MTPDYVEIIKNHYKKFFNREPDEKGFNHYLYLLKSNKIKEIELENIFKNSIEFKRLELSKKFQGLKLDEFTGKYEIKYLLQPWNALHREVKRNGVYFRIVIDLLKRFLKPTDTIFDIGAYVGFLSLVFAKIIVPKGCVFAFEPQDDIRKRLLEHVSLNQFTNIIVKPYIIQDNPNLKHLVLYKKIIALDDGIINDAVSSILPYFSNRGTEEHITKTIDNFVNEENTSVNFIKIDVEGAESKVLQGGLDTITKYQPIILYEHALYSDKEWKINNCEDSFNFLKELEYKQFPIKKDTLYSELKEFDFDENEHVDMFCIPKSVQF